MLDQAASEAERDRYLAAGELWAEARDLGAVMAAPGDACFEADAAGLQLGMARVVVGERPRPRILSSRRWETHRIIDLVLNDPDANLTIIAKRSHGVRHAIGHSLAVEQKRALRINTRTITRREETQLGTSGAAATTDTESNRSEAEVLATLEPISSHASEGGPGLE